jgi:hypothetical protein
MLRICACASLLLIACGHAAPTPPAGPTPAAIPSGPVPNLDPDGDGHFGPGGDGSDTKWSYTDETFGGITFKLDPAGVAKLLGEPASKTPPAESEATGEWDTTWEYPAQGLTVIFGSTAEHGAYHVADLRAIAPCALKTSRGVGIGTSLDDVKRAYNTDITDGTVDQVLVGSMYGGMQLSINDGKVADIFIGVGAE